MVRTISFKMLYGLVILRHTRRRLVTIAVTANPTDQWIAGQVTDAFPWDEAPPHLLRDRDGAFGPAYTCRIRAMRIRGSPDCAALALAERLCRAAHRINSARKPRPPHRVRRSAAASRSEEVRFLLQSGPHASFTGQERTGFSRPQKLGPIAAIPILGGLHHQYVRV